jgi:hypothetical protein
MSSRTLICLTLLCCLLVGSILVSVNCIYYARTHPPHLLHRQLKKLAARFHRICESRSIGYGICFGTLLGACRERDIIAHDDDVDVLMYQEELTKLQGVTVGSVCVKSDTHCYKFTDESLPGVFLDIFPVEEDKRGNVIFCNRVARLAWPSFRIPVSDMLNLQLYQLGTYVEDDTVHPLAMFGPRNGIEFCQNYFGADWREPIITHRHIHNLGVFRRSEQYDAFHISVASVSVILCIGLLLELIYSRKNQRVRRVDEPVSG